MLNRIGKVNFFLVGGPKCGTTAMVSYLKTHPDIYMSEPKESNFFLDDMAEMKYISRAKEYAQLFNNFESDHKIFCDASILYMYSEKALKNIYRYNPEAKVVIMLRDPIEMVHSFHSQIVYTLDEDVDDFEKAWDLESERKQGQNLPKNCRDVKLLYYSEIAKYNLQLKRVYRLFPREQVMVILFRDFKNSNLDTYKKLLEFLGVPYDGRTDFPVVNEAKTAKSRLINKFVNRPPKVLKRTSKYITKILNKPRLGLLERLDKLNRAKDTKQELPNALRHKIKKAYQDDVKALEHLLKRDLGHWLK